MLAGDTMLRNGKIFEIEAQSSGVSKEAWSVGILQTHLANAVDYFGNFGFRLGYCSSNCDRAPEQLDIKPQPSF